MRDSKKDFTSGRIQGRVFGLGMETLIQMLRKGGGKWNK